MEEEQSSEGGAPLACMQMRGRKRRRRSRSGTGRRRSRSRASRFTVQILVNRSFSPFSNRSFTASFKHMCRESIRNRHFTEENAIKTSKSH